MWGQTLFVVQYRFCKYNLSALEVNWDTRAIKNILPKDGRSPCSHSCFFVWQTDKLLGLLKKFSNEKSKHSELSPIPFCVLLRTGFLEWSITAPKQGIICRICNPNNHGALLSLFNFCSSSMRRADPSLHCSRTHCGSIRENTTMFGGSR